MYREMKGIEEEEDIFVEETSEVPVVEEKEVVALVDDYFEED